MQWPVAVATGTALAVITNVVAVANAAVRATLARPLFSRHVYLAGDLRRLARRYPRIVYNALFRAAQGALTAFGRDPKRLGVEQMGFLAVLHTWGRDLSYHPHLHVVVPGGGLDQSGHWMSSPQSLSISG